MTTGTLGKTALRAVAAAGLALSFAIADRAAAAPINVGLELALLVDVSGSVDASEYALQMGGYKAAFNSVAIQNAIAANPTGSIAVSVVQWASGNQQQLSIGWTQVTAANAGAFGDQIGNLARAFSGNTGPGSAINFITPLFFTNLFEAPRQVIDVSGDGAQNSGDDTSDARDAALAAGIDTINGVVIEGGASLLSFYVNNIQGGTGAFVLQADSFANFSSVVASKLEREIATVPEPLTLSLFGVGLAGLALVRRRTQA